MNRTIKTRPAKEINMGDGKMIAVDHFVYVNGQRVGTVLESRYGGKTWFEAKRGKETLMKGYTNHRFTSVEAAAAAI